MTHSDRKDPERTEFSEHGPSVSILEQDPSMDDLLTFYEENEEDEEAAAQARLSFLTQVEENPDLLDEESVAHFLATKIEPYDFDKLQWKAPINMLEFCEVLYGFRFQDESITKQIRTHVGHLLQNALRRHEEDEEWEKLFSLVQIAPTSPVMQNVELRRLRHLARAYELRRVERNRRIIYGYLVAQVFLVLVVFPFLFINSENGEIQRRVEALTDVQIGDEGYRLFTYTDGLYWTIVTAASIGYGDITPMTTMGKFIAVTIGTMGVLTVGVIAGLILKWVTPRTLD